MPSEPTVSVCLPVFNGEAFLSAAIESVLKQSCQDFELLVSDDCSRDRSFEIIEAFSGIDKRIRFWRNENNVGLFANYNRCLEKSRGRYIKFFAQDDLLHEKSLEIGVNILDAHENVGLLANKRKWIDDEGDDISEFVQTPSCEFYLASNRTLNGLDVIRQCLCEMANYIGEPSTVMIRKSQIGAGFDTSFHHLGDLELWLRVLRHSGFYYLDEVYSYFRVHDASRSSVNSRELLMVPDLVRLARKFEDLLPEFGQTYERLMLKTSRGLAGHVRFLAMTNQLNGLELKSSGANNRYLEAVGSRQTQCDELQDRVLNDLLAFRELAFYSLRELGAARETESKRKDPVTRKIVETEAKLGRLLNSPSWRATKILRELKVRATSRKSGGVDPVTAVESEFCDPELYLQYLNSQVLRVKASRSWRITKPIRTIGLF